MSRWLTFALSVWAAGVLCSEALAAVGMALTALLVAVDGWRDGGIRDRAAWRRELPILLFVALALGVPSLVGHLPTGTGAARLLNLVAIPVAAVAAKKLTRRQLGTVAAAASAVLLLSCVAALLQHYGAWPSEEKLGLLARLRINVVRMYEPVPNEPGHFMAGGLLFHRLKFAHVGGLAALALLACAFAAHGRRRWFFAGVTVVSVIAVMWLPYARAAAVSLVLAIAVELALALPLSRRVKALTAGAVVIVAALVLALIPGFRERLRSSSSTEGSGARSQIHQAGIAAVEANPWTGVGVGRFKLAQWAPPDAPSYVLENSGKTHNQLLTIAAESGVPVALLFVAVLLTLALRLWRVRVAAPWGLPALFFFALLSLAHDPLFHAEFGMALPLALGTALGFRSVPGPGER